MNSSTIINRPVIPKFNPGSGLRSPLDTDDLTNQWKKSKVGSESTFGLAVAVQRHERQLAKLRRRIITPTAVAAYPVSSTTFDFPFRIHHPSIVGTTVAQIADNAIAVGCCNGYSYGDILTLDGGIVAAGGSPTQFQVALGLDFSTGGIFYVSILNAGLYSTPPSSPQTVTGGTGTGAMFSIPLINVGSNYACGINSNNLYDVSQGIIGWRSKVFAPDAQGQIIGRVTENWEVLLTCGNVDPNTNVSGSGALSNGVMGVNYGSDIRVPEWAQIQINPYPISSDNSVSFWALITDDLSLPVSGPQPYPYASLWARGFNGLAPISEQVFPDPASNPNVIPIGYIQGIYETPTQVQFGNLVNRYPTEVTIQRGSWTADSLVNQVFYNGDIVIDDSLILFTISGHNAYGVYKFTGGVAKVTLSPATDTVPWKLNSTIFQ